MNGIVFCLNGMSKFFIFWICLQYENGEEVVLWMNTVGPYHNRQETYSYFSLPFCAGPKKSISHYHETLGEALQGVELEFSGLDIDYKGKLEICFWCDYADQNIKTIHKKLYV